MKIFEVAGEGKLHGLTVMSLDKFVKKEVDVEESSKELPQWKKDWYAKQKPNSWPKHPQPYHNPNWIDELSPEEREKLIKGKGVTEGSGQKTFTVVYYSKKTDRNVTKNIKANNESQVWDQLKLKGIDVVSVKEQGLNEFALPGSGDGDSGRWYTDDELADIIGDDWFEDFDVSHDEFNIDAYGEKAKKNLASYANSWFDDKGYNVNVMGVDHNEVDHDLKWYIVGSFHNPRFANEGVAEGSSNIEQKIIKLYKQGLSDDEIASRLKIDSDDVKSVLDDYEWVADTTGEGKGVGESNSAVIASTADRLSNKDDGRTAKLRAAGDARREQHLKGRDIAKNDRSSKDAWGDLKERASQLLSAEDRNGVITVIVQAPDGTKKSLANDNPNYINQWLSAKYGLTLPKSITSKFAGMNEAPGDFGLGANYRAVPDAEMQDLMGRSKNKTKTKRDKFDYPYIHGSNIEVKDEAGKKFDTEKLKAAIMTRPANILGQNAKMQHSETGTEAIFDIGLPALKGLAVNEKTGEFVVVDTCPGAGACQTYCYAMKGSYVMFKAVSMGLARMLNFLLNDPAGFADKLNSEIAAARSKYAKKGAKIVVRWHDAGDFFSPEYMDMAYGVARANPDVGFYAYTKMGDVANAARPANFNMNFSQGAKSGQEKKVNITRTKHSKVVPKDMFFDLIARKGNELIKDAKGRMQFASPENLDKFKTIMATKYAIDKDSILTYDQMMKTPVGAEPKWNVIVMPGDGDNSANRNDVVGSYLLFH